MKRDCPHPIANHQHGTSLAYNHDACRCPECREAHRLDAANRRKLIAYGRYTKKRVKPDKAIQHIQALKAAGVSYQTIARHTHITVSTIHRIAWGQAKTIQPQNETRILALTLDKINTGTFISGLGTARRVQALTANGWAQIVIAHELGIKPAHMTAIVLYGRAVTKELADKTRELYDELWDKQPPTNTPYEKRLANAARTIAKRNKWAPPLAWDDDTLENPDSRPILGGTGPRTKALIENVTELHRNGATREEIAARTGRQWATIEKRLRERGHGALITTINQEAA